MKSDVRRWMPWVTVLIDALLITLAFVVAYWVRYDLQWFRSVDPANNVPFVAYLPMVIPLTAILLLTMRREGAYDVRRQRSITDEIYAVLNATTTAIMLVVVFVFFYRRLFYSRMIFIYGGILVAALLVVARIARRSSWRVSARPGRESIAS